MKYILRFIVFIIMLFLWYPFMCLGFIIFDVIIILWNLNFKYYLNPFESRWFEIGVDKPNWQYNDYFDYCYPNIFQWFIRNDKSIIEYKKKL